MKRLIGSILALSLLGSSVAAAAPYRGAGDHRAYNGYSTPYRGYGYGYGYRDHNRGNAAAAVGLGILAFGLFAALASQNHDDGAHDRYAPPPGYGYGGYGYDRGYGYSGYGGYGYGR